MLICIFAPGIFASMSELQTPIGIADEHLAASAPYVRALLVTRLEQIWAACQPYILGVDEQGTRLRPDPRFVESGLRCCDRLASLYRLDKPVAGATEALAGTRDPKELVLAALEELEARMKPAEAAEDPGGGSRG